MLENQFIQFKRGGNGGCQFPVPFTFGNGDIIVYFENPGSEEEITFAVTNMEGKDLTVTTLDITVDVPFEISNIITKEGADSILQDGQHFRLRYWFSDGVVWESNVLCYVADGAGLSVLKYRCNEDCFGFPFASYGGEASVLLPILLSKPQYNQEDKVYTKSNGQTVVLYAQARKEWSGETEYLPEDMHDKIAVALMCDEVSINGRRVFKSGQYNVDWESYDTLSDGTKTARATFAVEENTVSRNSNY